MSTAPVSHKMLPGQKNLALGCHSPALSVSPSLPVPQRARGFWRSDESPQGVLSSFGCDSHQSHVLLLEVGRREMPRAALAYGQVDSKGIFQENQELESAPGLVP